jgi:hypothetical protein
VVRLGVVDLALGEVIRRGSHRLNPPPAPR